MVTVTKESGFSDAQELDQGLLLLRGPQRVWIVVAVLEFDGHALQPLLADPQAEWPRKVLYTERLQPNGNGPYELEYVDCSECCRGSFRSLESGSLPSNERGG